VVGSVLQVLFQVCALIVEFTLSVYMPSEIMKHRTFLTIHIVVVMLSASSFCCSPVYFGFVCPLQFGMWLFFHAAVDFLKVPCIVFGVLLAVLSGYVHCVQSACLWREFQATGALEKKASSLEKERELLKMAQESLHRILAIISDASCTCDRDGQLHECSPQLKQILDLPSHMEELHMDSEHSQDLQNLGAFAAGNSESKRLREFLASCRRHQASTIQCSFRRLTTGPPPSELIDARLYAIAMPSTSTASDVVFITLQTHSIAPIKEAPEASNQALVAEMRKCSPGDLLPSLALDETSALLMRAHPQADGIDHESPHLVGVRETRKEVVGRDESIGQAMNTAFVDPARTVGSANNEVLPAPASSAKGSRISLSKMLPAPASSSKSSRISSRSSSASSQSATQEHTTRKIMGLDKVQMKVDLCQQSARDALICEYALCLSQDHQHQGRKPSQNLPSLSSCFLCEEHDPFLTWFNVNVNDLWHDDVSEAEYHGKIMFRPPTAACASSKVILCAESARLFWSKDDSDAEDSGDDGDDCQETLQLELYDVSEIVRCRHSVIKTGQRELPILDEVNEMV